jgi:hypothetical protein
VEALRGRDAGAQLAAVVSAPRVSIERHSAVYAGVVSSREITDELLDQVVVDLQERGAE